MNTSGNAERKTRFTKRPWIIVVLLFLVLVLVAAGLHWWIIGRFIQSTDDAYVRADVVTVSPHVSGYVDVVSVNDNQFVHRGDALVTLDNRDYRAKVEGAEAAVSAAMATLQAEQANAETLSAQANQQHSVIAQAQAEQLAAQAETTWRNSDEARYSELRTADVASTQRWEQAHADAVKARAELASAIAVAHAQAGQQTVLDKKLAQSSATINQARARLVAAQAQLTQAKLDLEYTVIHAPCDGVIGQRAARAGQYVEPGMPLLAVVPLEKAYVVANLKETQVGDVQPGQHVNITSDIYPGRTLHGKVLGLSPGSGAEFALLPPDNATGNFTKIVQRVPVKISIDDASANMVLRPGTSVIVNIDTHDVRGGRP